MKCKISASITDFPIQTPIEEFFSSFKKAGVDAVEIVLGLKTLPLSRMVALSEKYDLPIASFHQSPWSGFGFTIDEVFIKQAQSYGITIFTFHPLTFTSFGSQLMNTYFAKLAKLQQTYGVTICLENMPNEIFYRKLFAQPYDKMDKQLEKTYQIAKEYGLSITYDTSHPRFPRPQDHEVFKKMLPLVKNIHLGSFHGGYEHLSLDTGDFDTKSFLMYLAKEHYKGLLTFEINYSLTKRLFTPYDFSEIKRSVDLIRSIPGK